MGPNKSLSTKNKTEQNQQKQHPTFHDIEYMHMVDSASIPYFKNKLVSFDFIWIWGIEQYSYTVIL